MHPARRPPLLAAVLAVVLIVGSAPVPAVDSANLGAVGGKVLDATGKSAVVGATVLAYHLSSATVYRSEPTAENGKYELTGLPHGYYDMAVDHPDGFYVGNQVVNVPPGGKASANFSLLESSSFGPDTRDFPGADKAASGIAQYSKTTGKKKVALITGGSLLGLGLLFGLGGDSSSGGGLPPSPSAPPTP